MAERHISMRGEVVDFNRLRLKNSEKPALGNASMNARGDIVQKGTVIKTQEQIDAEWEAKIAEQQSISQPVDLKNQTQMAAAAGSPAPQTRPQKQLEVDDAAFDPEAIRSAPRRKIIESDE